MPRKGSGTAASSALATWKPRTNQQWPLARLEAAQSLPGRAFDDGAAKEEAQENKTHRITSNSIHSFEFSLVEFADHSMKTRYLAVSGFSFPCVPGRFRGSAAGPAGSLPAPLRGLRLATRRDHAQHAALGSSAGLLDQAVDARGAVLPDLVDVRDSLAEALRPWRGRS